MYTTPFENKFANYDNSVDVVMTFAIRKIKDLIQKKAERIYVESTMAEVQTQIREARVDISQPGNNTASNYAKEASIWFLKTILV